MGIMNGTTNYMLSRMETERAEYGEVLEEAQALGYAEGDILCTSQSTFNPFTIVTHTTNVLSCHL